MTMRRSLKVVTVSHQCAAADPVATSALHAKCPSVHLNRFRDGKLDLNHLEPG